MLPEEIHRGCGHTFPSYDAPMQTPEERKEHIEHSTNPFVDARGRIDNYNLVAPINMANIITSKPRTIRANHYHPEKTQQCLVISGSYVSVFKDLLNPSAELRSQVVRAGELSVMPTMVAHAMIFREDTVFLNLVGGNRDHDKFGKRTVPYVLVRDEDIDIFVQKHANELG